MGRSGGRNVNRKAPPLHPSPPDPLSTGPVLFLGDRRERYPRQEGSGSSVMNRGRDGLWEVDVRFQTLPHFKDVLQFAVRQ